MYIRGIKKTGCLAAILIAGCLSVPASAEEVQPQTEEIQTEKESETILIKETTENANYTEETPAQTEALPEDQTETENNISIAAESSKPVAESIGEVTVSNWEWDDKENVIQDNTIDIVCKNENYMLTYQNFSECLPDNILLDEANSIEIQEWKCQETILEPGSELFSLRKDAIHLLAVLDKPYKLDPDPLLTIRFLNLTPSGKFTGKETGIWKWVVKNK